MLLAATGEADYLHSCQSSSQPSLPHQGGATHLPAAPAFPETSTGEKGGQDPHFGPPLSFAADLALGLVTGDPEARTPLRLVPDSWALVSQTIS